MSSPVVIDAGGRSIPLVFDMISWGQMEEEIAPLQDISELLNGTSRVKTVLKLIRILGNEGLEISGQKPDLTEKWLGRNMHPKAIGDLSVKAMDAVTAGMEMETSADDGKKEIDVTLQEINKKKEPEG